MSFRIFVTSPPDREKVVAEIWHDDGQVVELSIEHDTLDLEIYRHPSGGVWRFPFDEFLMALTQAKSRLLNKET